MDMRKIVGLNVRRTRIAAGLKQEALAELVGHTQQYISKLESGRRNPTIITLFEFAQALGTTPAALVSPPNDTGEEASNG
jgi:transcriptional regulator with XRE-family HTH domain